MVNLGFDGAAPLRIGVIDHDVKPCPSEHDCPASPDQAGSDYADATNCSEFHPSPPNSPAGVCAAGDTSASPSPCASGEAHKELIKRHLPHDGRSIRRRRRGALKALHRATCCGSPISLFSPLILNYNLSEAVMRRSGMAGTALWRKRVRNQRSHAKRNAGIGLTVGVPCG